MDIWKFLQISSKPFLIGHEANLDPWYRVTREKYGQFRVRVPLLVDIPLQCGEVRF